MLKKRTRNTRAFENTMIPTYMCVYEEYTLRNTHNVQV